MKRTASSRLRTTTLPFRVKGGSNLNSGHSRPHQHSRADEDLTGLGFIAQPRGDVGYRADGGIVEASLEPDGAKRSEAVRNADAEANLVPEAAPGYRQSSDGLTQF